MKIGLIGAIDRYNYGDVLFPIIVEKALKERNKKIEFKYYAYVESDLTKYGAVRTVCISEISNDRLDGIVVVGGEVLTSSFGTTYFHLQKNALKIFSLRIIKKLIGETNFDNYCKKKLNAKQHLPWIFSKEDYPNTKIVYNAVGGSGENSIENEKKYLKKVLNEADYFSVRENLTKEAFNRIGVNNIQLSPDSAFIMSDYFPIDHLKSLITRNLITNIFEGKYCVFQIGLKYAKGNIDIICKELIKINEKLKLKIVLLPIGQAALHEDYKPLKKIYGTIIKMKPSCQKEFILIKDNTIYDTMYIIAKSELFLGTSLHGNVTALSYGNPSIGLDVRIPKLTELLKYCSIQEQAYSIEYKNMYNVAEHSLQTDRDILIENSKKLKSKVNENFDRMMRSINL